MIVGDWTRDSRACSLATFMASNRPYTLWQSWNDLSSGIANGIPNGGLFMYIMLYYIILSYVMLCYIISYYIVLYCIILYYIILYIYWIINILGWLHDIWWIKLANFWWVDWYSTKKSWSVCILCPIFSPFLRSKHSLLPWDAMQICVHTNACNTMPFPTQRILSSWQATRAARHETSWDVNKIRTAKRLEEHKAVQLGSTKKHNGSQSRIKVGRFFVANCSAPKVAFAHRCCHHHGVDPPMWSSSHLSLSGSIHWHQTHVRCICSWWTASLRSILNLHYRICKKSACAW